jgi:hypothetical protein
LCGASRETQNTVGISDYRINSPGLVIYVALAHGENLPLLAFSIATDYATSIASNGVLEPLGPMKLPKLVLFSKPILLVRP